MRYTTLGNTGLKVSELCLGTNRFGTKTCDEASSHRILDVAVERGINFIDTADVYGESEAVIGSYVKRRPSSAELIIATKFGLNVDNDPNFQVTKRTLIRAVEKALRRLQRDYIDIFYLHTWFELDHLPDVLRALDDLVTQGKILHVGCSNFPTWVLARALWLADVRGLTRPELVQSVFSVLRPDLKFELAPFAAQHNVSVAAYSPLATGLLGSDLQVDALEASSNAKYSDRRLAHWREKFGSPTQVAVLKKLLQVAAKYDCKISALALDWVLRNGANVCVFGASSADQLTDTIAGYDSLAAAGAEPVAEFAAAADELMASFVLQYPPPMGGSYINDAPYQRVTV